jgi:hypothetical protein
MVELGFNGFCFVWVSVVYVLLDYINAFQVKTWVDLRRCAHNDLCRLNIIVFEMIVYVLEIIISCFICLV